MDTAPTAAPGDGGGGAAAPAAAPGPNAEIEFNFDDDTGSTHMLIFEEDMRQLMGLNANTQAWPWEQIMGYDLCTLADGTEMAALDLLVEVNMYDKRPGAPRRQLMMHDWVPINCSVVPGAHAAGRNDRLLGNWLRFCLYTATAPEDPPKFFVSTTKTGLIDKSMLSTWKRAPAKGPPLARSYLSARYAVDAKGVKKPTKGVVGAGTTRNGRFPGEGQAILRQF